MSEQNKLSYNFLYNTYEWFVPNNFNIAQACCHRWAASPHEARQAAIYFEDQVGQLTSLSFGKLSEKVNKLANGFIRMGVHPQDRIAIALNHSAETAITILAVITVGAIAVPLGAGLSHTDYEKYLIDSGAKIAVVDKHTISPMTNAIDHNPILRQSLKQIIGIHTEDERVIPWRTLLARQPSLFNTIPSSPDTPAIMIYQKGMKATLISHNALVGSLPGFVASQNWFPKKRDILYTSYDWSSHLGLLGALLPTLYFGQTIVGCPSGRTIPRLFTLLEHYPISNILISRAELERIKNFKDPLLQFELGLRCIVCPNEEYSEELSQWVKERFGISVNQAYMPLGFSYIIIESSEKWVSKPGSMGKAAPGFNIKLLDQTGKPVKLGNIGYICIHANDKLGDPNPALSTQYWENGQIHTIPVVGDRWFNTGLTAYADNDGYYWLGSTSKNPVAN